MTPSGKDVTLSATPARDTVSTLITEAMAGVSIARIDSVRSALQPNVTHIVVTDSDGVTGVGETFYGASSVEAHLHDVIVPAIASDHPAATPFDVSRVLQGYVGYAGSGSEVRARSALDIALWDIAAKRLGVSLSKLLAPNSSTSIPIYNTCSGALYVNQESRQSSTNWGIAEAKPDTPYEDLWGFLNEPGRLARELRDAGFRGMKVWPFDMAAEEARGGTETDFRFGLKVLDEIRQSVGSDMDIYVELHSLLQFDAAVQLLGELTQFELAWVEDPIRADNIDGLRALRDMATMPIAVGENLGAGLNGYPLIIEGEAVDTMIMDLGWCGGITEALPWQEAAGKKNMSVAYHDCTGPVSLAVATHVSLASAYTNIQEVARAFAHTWYPDMAEGLPKISHGQVTVSEEPGHGVTLTPEFLAAKDTRIRSSVVN
jgi:galactonate dehydratase